MNDNKQAGTAGRIVLTGGGTAGHVTPNLAIIPRLKERGYEIHYIGTKDGIERQLVEGIEGVTYHAISSGKLRRYFSVKNFTDPFRVIAGISQSRRLLKQLRPRVVFSKGGFVAVPVVMSAKKYAPIVSHESDYTPGLANKIAARYARKICVTFEDTKQFIGEKAVFTGSPIRSELFAGDRARGLDVLGFSGSKPVLMIMGGSLGAQAINEAVRASLDELTSRFDIVHLCGKGKTAPEYDRSGYRQFEYMSDELADVFAATDLVLSRAGANAIFEFLALEKPALLVPLPANASRGDQLLNAEYFKKRGYADVLAQEDITPTRLVERLFALADNREVYAAAMRSADAKAGAQNVLRVIFETIN